MFLKACGIIVYIIILPSALIYQTLKHYIRGPTHPAWGLFEELFVFSGRLYYFVVHKPSMSSSDPSAQAQAMSTLDDFDHTAWEVRQFAKWRVGKGTKVTKVRIACANESCVKGIATIGKQKIRKVDIPGFWVHRADFTRPADGRAGDGEKVILFAPGGGIHALTSPVSYGLALSTHKRVLAINTRPATSPSTAFPTQLLDGLAAYCYLTQQLGFEPQNIMLIGESAGAYIHLALMTYLGELKDEGLDMGMVGAAALMSPACNLSRSDHPPVNTDFRFPTYRARVVPIQTSHFDQSTLAKSPYFSPALCGKFSHLTNTKVWIQYGDGELFADDIKKLVERMREQGVDVQEDAVWGGLHCDCTIRRAFGKTDGSWKSFLEAVEGLGWGKKDD